MPSRIGLDKPAPFKVVASWVLYDLANTIFSMGVVSIYFSQWLRAEVGEARVDLTLGIITSISMGIIFVISPLVGAMTDRAKRRMPFLIVSTVLCVGFTLMLARSGYWGTVIAFVIANAAYQAGLQFYDALLPEVTTEENRGRIGGIGVGIGYTGSYIAVGIGILLGTSDFALLFTIIAIAFIAFSIPCFLYVKERGNPNAGRVFDPKFIVASTRKTFEALKYTDKFPGLARFLIGRVFYTDAVNTVISFMTPIALNLFVLAGRTEQQASDEKDLVMMSAISCAIVGGIVWGRIVDRLGPKRTLDIVLYLWLSTLVLASAMAWFGMPPGTLWVVAALAGIGMGGIWSADRPLMLRLTPPDRIGEFYGLYGMVGRFSAIIGPIIWGVSATLTVRALGYNVGAGDTVPIATLMKGQGVAIAILFAMVLLSWRILRRVDDKPRDWQQLNAGSATQ
ncbi:MAG TPA: MFS transporter [Gemmatimonadaceae bacterium]|nr:MFS transporter [Gemmatimonadaceae bacterium]